MGPDEISQLTTCLLSGDGVDMMESRLDVIDTSPEIKCSHFDQGEGQDAAKCSESESSEEKTCAAEINCGDSR